MSMMSYIHGLRLYVRISVYVAILAIVLHMTVCLESRRSEDKHVFVPQCSNDVDIYDHEQCKLETNEEIKPSAHEDPFEMLPSRYIKGAKPILEKSEKQDKQCVVYMQRFINLFLRRSGLSVSQYITIM